MLTFAGLGYTAYKGYRAWRARTPMVPRGTTTGVIGRTKPL